MVSSGVPLLLAKLFVAKTPFLSLSISIYVKIVALQVYKHSIIKLSGVKHG